MIKDLVEYVIKSLVDYPDHVHISVVKSGVQVSIEITVDAQDRGKVIGKEGQTIKALRGLINAAVSPEQKVTIEVMQSKT